MTDLILIFAFILGVQYSNPFWVHGHVPPLKGGRAPWHMKRGMRLQRKRDCVIWKEKHPAWINQQPYYQHITWLNRDYLPCRFTTFDRYDYGEKTVYTCFRWSRIGHPKSNREKIVVFCAYESRSKTATFSRGKTIFADRKRVFSCYTWTKQVEALSSLPNRYLSPFRL